MSPWTYLKYVFALVGVALVVSADRLGLHWLGYVGLGLLLVAFLLRLKYRISRHSPPT